MCTLSKWATNASCVRKGSPFDPAALQPNGQVIIGCGVGAVVVAQSGNGGICGSNGSPNGIGGSWSGVKVVVEVDEEGDVQSGSTVCTEVAPCCRTPAK